MTSDQIVNSLSSCGWGVDGKELFNLKRATEVTTLRAILEVAYQLARLNEGFESLTSQRGNQQLRVQVEPGTSQITKFGNGGLGMSKCNQSPAEDHDFQVLKATWQVPNLMISREDLPFLRDGVKPVLEHSKERLVCKRCGEVVDAFPEMEVGSA